MPNEFCEGIHVSSYPHLRRLNACGSVKLYSIPAIMKNLKMFGLVLLGIVATFYVGVNGLSENTSWGPFFIFVAVCCTVGFTIDLFNHFRPKRTR